MRRPYTLRGYFGVPKCNARTLSPDGFYRSGDLMRRHPFGNYIVEGRKKGLINRGGEKISAEEVENLTLSHPAGLNVARVPTIPATSCSRVMVRPSRGRGRRTSAHREPGRACGGRNGGLSAVGRFRQLARLTTGAGAAAAGRTFPGFHGRW